MTIYKAPLDDQRFALFDLLGAEAVLMKLQGGAEHGRDLLDAVLEEAGRLAEQVLAPTNAPGDAEGCRYDKATRTVTTPKGFKEAFKAFADGGWAGLTAKEQRVARLLLKGLTTAEIARVEGNSDKTIKQHATAIYAKCGVSTRAELFHHLLPT